MLYEGIVHTHMDMVQWSKSVPALRKGEVPNLYLDMCYVWVDHGSVSAREKKELEHYQTTHLSLCTANMPRQCHMNKFWFLPAKELIGTERLEFHRNFIHGHYIKILLPYNKGMF